MLSSAFHLTWLPVPTPSPAHPLVPSLLFFQITVFELLALAFDPGMMRHSISDSWSDEKHCLGCPLLDAGLVGGFAGHPREISIINHHVGAAGVLPFI